MNDWWGSDIWKKYAYKKIPTLFGEDEVKTDNDKVVEGYRQQLQQEAGFKFVPKPIAMRNSQNAVLYYLFFASHNATGEKIAKQIFRKYDKRGSN